MDSNIIISQDNENTSTDEPPYGLTEFQRHAWLAAALHRLELERAWRQNVELKTAFERALAELAK